MFRRLLSLFSHRVEPLPLPDRKGLLIYLQAGDRFATNDVTEYDGCVRIVGHRTCHFRALDVVREIDVKIAKPRRYVGRLAY